MVDSLYCLAPIGSFGVWPPSSSSPSSSPAVKVSVEEVRLDETTSSGSCNSASIPLPPREPCRGHRGHRELLKGVPRWSRYRSALCRWPRRRSGKPEQPATSRCFGRGAAGRRAGGQPAASQLSSNRRTGRTRRAFPAPRSVPSVQRALSSRQTRRAAVSQQALLAPAYTEVAQDYSAVQSVTVSVAKDTRR